MSTNVEYTQKKLHAFDKHILKWKLFSTVKKSGSYKGKRGWLQRFLWVQYEWSKDIMRQNNESPKTYGYKAYIIAFYSANHYPTCFCLIKFTVGFAPKQRTLKAFKKVAKKLKRHGNQTRMLVDALMCEYFVMLC